MADVSVEFGAKDTGLESTLKTVQDELARLDEKVKGGELSFNELQSTMKKVAQAEKLKSQLEGMAQATGDAGNAAGTAAPKVDEIGKETKKAGKEAEDFGEKSKGGFLKMSGAVAAGQLAAEAAMAGIRAAINLAKGAIDEFGAALDLGGRLSDLAARTGEAEGNLLLLERAFQNSGAGAEQVGPAINKLQRFMEEASNGAAAQVDTMTRLGLSYDELAGKTPTEQLEIFAKRISAIEDPSKRAALAMDVFGRSGGELLPLLTNFSGELGTAQSQLGGMVDIMNRNAATFDAVSDKIKIVRGKFTDFAAGILDRVVPALNAITEGLSRIDAAALGQKLADAFLGGQNAMKGFQAAVDAFKIGEFGKAFELIFESIKLQLMQTGNAIITNFTAAFKTVGDVMAEIFRADGPSFMVIRSAFDFVASYAKEKIAGAMSEMFASMGPAFAKISEGLKQHADAGATASELALQRIPVAAQLASEDIAKTLGGATGIFNQNLAKSESKFFDIEAQQAKVKELQDQITGATEETNEKIGSSLSLNEDFNSSLDNSNEHLKLSKELAGQISGSTGEIKTNTEGATEEIKKFKSFVDLIAESKPDEPIKKLSEKTADARREIEAFGEYIGEDLGRMSFPDIAKKLGVDTLGMTGSEQIDAIVKHIQGELPKAKEGIVDEKESTDAVAATAKKAGEELKQALDYAIDTGQGGKVLGSIEGIVKTISEIVAVIRDRLPQQALA